MKRKLLTLMTVLTFCVIGCNVTVKNGDPVSVDHWNVAEQRVIGDWALLMGISVDDALLLQKDDFPIHLEGKRPDETTFEYDLDWMTWETTRDGFMTFRDYELDKIEKEEEKENE